LWARINAPTDQKIEIARHITSAPRKSGTWRMYLAVFARAWLVLDKLGLFGSMPRQQRQVSSAHLEQLIGTC
jgi:hypothetical protein